MDNSSTATSDNVLDYGEIRRRLAEPQPLKQADTNPQILVLFDAWRNILNARLLAVLALIGALGIFGFTISDPTALRLWGCTGYSIGVLWPTIWLYLVKGQ